LGLDGIGVQDDFFELGGHSLLATQAVARVRQLFQVPVPLRWFFDAPSVAAFAEMLLSDPQTGPIVQGLADRLTALSELSDEELEQRLRGAGRNGNDGWG